MAAELARGGTGAAPAFPALIPQPLAQAPERGTFPLGPEARVVVRSRARDAVRVGELLARSRRPATGYRLPVVATRPRAGDVVLALVPGDTALGDEGYRLTVDGAAVTVSARRAPGLFWGTQTLRQLLPARTKVRHAIRENVEGAPMFTCEILLAAALITAPKDAQLPQVQSAWLEAAPRRHGVAEAPEAALPHSRADR